MVHYTVKWRSVKAVATLQGGDVRLYDLDFGPDGPVLPAFRGVCHSSHESGEALAHAFPLLAELPGRLDFGHFQHFQ